MPITGKLSEIRDKVRNLTAMPSTSQVTDSDLNDVINDYYQNQFPLEVDVPELRGFFSQSTSVADDGAYSVSADVLKLQAPVMVNGEKVSLTFNESSFFDKYPKTDGGTAYNITDPSLTIGSSDTAAVKNSAFTYRIDQHSYSKASAETSLSGSVVPQNKYSAFKLEVNSDGTVTVTQASDTGSKVIGSDLNEYRCIVSHTSSAATKPVTGASYAAYWTATGNTGSSETWESGQSYVAEQTGFTTPALAVDALDNESSDKACMGFVTVVNTSGTFTPGTTALNASGVTATYTDGKFSDRDQPVDLLYYENTLYTRPKPDDIYYIEIGQISKPTALSSDTDTVTDARWYNCISYGAAINYLEEKGLHNKAASLVNMYNYYKVLVNRKKVGMVSGSQTKRRF